MRRREETEELLKREYHWNRENRKAMQPTKRGGSDYE